MGHEACVRSRVVTYYRSLESTTGVFEVGLVGKIYIYIDTYIYRERDIYIYIDR